MRCLLVLSLLGLASCGGVDDESHPRPEDYDTLETCPQERDPATYEHCGALSTGWEGWCEDGLIHVRYLGGATYCTPGTEHALCTTIGRDPGSPEYRCTQGCNAPTSTRPLAETEDAWGASFRALCVASAAEPL